MCWPGLQLESVEARIFGEVVDDGGGREMVTDSNELDFDERRLMVAGRGRWEMFRWAIRSM